MLKEMIYDGGKTYSELVCGLAILDIRGYDIKELWINIRRHIPSECNKYILFRNVRNTYIKSNNICYIKQ
jgi:hypothetical protein